MISQIFIISVDNWEIKKILIQTLADENYSTGMNKYFCSLLIHQLSNDKRWCSTLSFSLGDVARRSPCILSRSLWWRKGARGNGASPTSPQRAAASTPVVCTTPQQALDRFSLVSVAMRECMRPAPYGAFIVSLRLKAVQDQHHSMLTEMRNDKGRGI